MWGRRLWLVFSRLSLLWAALVFTFAAQAQAPQLQQFDSRAYAIHTNLAREQVVEFGRHMDAVFGEYEQRFASFRGRRRGNMPLYLFQSQQDYLAFLAGYGIDGTNSGGMFFVRPGVQGLATFVEGNSRARTFAVLQHEGFHQFAYNYIGTNLPIWANEGIAQYFEDGILVRGRMTLGLSNKRRIDAVKAALREERAIPFDTLLNISGQEWGLTLNTDPQRAALLYAQSWSVVYFLIHGDRGRYRNAFEQYLQLVSSGRDSGRSFRQAFGTSDTVAFEQRWRQFALGHEPDALNVALARLDFLGSALRFLHQRQEDIPGDFDALKQRLQAIEFRTTYSDHGIREQYHARDEENFRFPRPNGADAPFRLLEAARNDLPPRVSAPGLRPEPTLTWSRDPEGNLVQEIEFR